MGHTVWLMNSRGTEYSRTHTVYEATEQAYWDFSIFDMWKDIEANINIIKSYLGYDTYWYVGYSGATSQMLYAMTLFEPFLFERLRRAILLAPCTIPKFPPPGAVEIWTSGIDVYEFSGPNWSESDERKACSVVSDEVCLQLNRYDNLEPTSVKTNVHQAQMNSMERFQEFVEGWPTNKMGREIRVSDVS